MGKVRQVLGSRRDISEREELTDAELNKYLTKYHNLLWLECERFGVLPSVGPARFSTLPTWPPGGFSDVEAAAGQIPLARNV